MKCGESDQRNDDYEKNYTPEKFFQRMIASDAPLIIDIGAHKGESVVFFKSIFPDADIYSVEPDPNSFKDLLKHFPDTSKAVNAAVTAEVGNTTLFQYDISHLNSLYAINKESKDSLGYAETSSATEVEVRCVTLDGLVSELNLSSKKIDLIKIDAQGGEYDILHGANSVLEQVDNITLEINLFDFYSKKNTFREIEDLLSDFELYAITKLSQNPKNFRTDWAEVFYTKIT